MGWLTTRARASLAAKVEIEAGEGKAAPFKVLIPLGNRGVSLLARQGAKGPSEPAVFPATRLLIINAAVVVVSILTGGASTVHEGPVPPEDRWL